MTTPSITPNTTFFYPLDHGYFLKSWLQSEAAPMAVSGAPVAESGNPFDMF